MATLPAHRMCRPLAFEALFLHALHAQQEGSLSDALRAEGYDPAQPPAPGYPPEVLRRCLEVAARHALPGLERDAAYRELGRLFVRGFGQTLLGRLVVPALPQLGPARVLQRYPDYPHADGAQLTLRSVQVAPRAFRLEFQGEPEAEPQLAAGSLEEVVRLTGVEPTVSLEQRGPGRFDAHVSW